MRRTPRQTPQGLRSANPLLGCVRLPAVRLSYRQLPLLDVFALPLHFLPLHAMHTLRYRLGLSEFETRPNRRTHRASR
jgi:hypothetical protein